jgi:hypothetical protein
MEPIDRELPFIRMNGRTKKIHRNGLLTNQTTHPPQILSTGEQGDQKNNFDELINYSKTYVKIIA